MILALQTDKSKFLGDANIKRYDHVIFFVLTVTVNNTYRSNIDIKQFVIT